MSRQMFYGQREICFDSPKISIQCEDLTWETSDPHKITDFKMLLATVESLQQEIEKLQAIVKNSEVLKDLGILQDKVAMIEVWMTEFMG